MIPETSAGLAALVATLSAALLAIFGVDYYSLLGGLVGAMLSLGGAARMSRGNSIVFVLLSTFVGAVLGNVVATRLDQPPRAVLILLCIGGGILAQALASALVAAGPRLADRALKWLERRAPGGGQ